MSLNEELGAFFLTLWLFFFTDVRYLTHEVVFKYQFSTVKQPHFSYIIVYFISVKLCENATALIRDYKTFTFIWVCPVWVSILYLSTTTSALKTNARCHYSSLSFQQYIILPVLQLMSKSVIAISSSYLID